ncbi:hypothetical protein [Rhodoplanes sp. Z2-YC6860]|uniref:hypothetical protein n=1 Tax=Rhodoplanes sp. Z2-YC6860 TaxID=674703 RepID=UPI00082FA8C0|nr:hypothetical protein [Rhodoplanes sp. Z2-YC6860]
MMNVESYREYAADCMLRAQSEQTPGDRIIVLNMALAWLRLARLTETLRDEPPQDTEPVAEDVREDEEALAS